MPMENPHWHSHHLNRPSEVTVTNTYHEIILGMWPRVTSPVVPWDNSWHVAKSYQPCCTMRQFLACGQTLTQWGLCIVDTGGGVNCLLFCIIVLQLCNAVLVWRIVSHFLQILVKIFNTIPLYFLIVALMRKHDLLPMYTFLHDRWSFGSLTVFAQ